jgi:hypothetical protein
VKSISGEESGKAGDGGGSAPMVGRRLPSSIFSIVPQVTISRTFSRPTASAATAARGGVPALDR